MAEIYGDNWQQNLFLWFLITWSIGLIPPLVIRFAIVRNQLGKIWSIAVAFCFWAFNLILFILLGSQNRAHSAVYIIAFISYFILRYKKKTGQERAAELADSQRKYQAEEFKKEKNLDDWNRS